MQATLTQQLWPAKPQVQWLRALVLMGVGSALLTASAKLSVPFYPVPFTFQTLMVLLLGMAYGWRLGLATVALYLAQGAMGLPVFSGSPEKGLGLAYLMGGTGGYLMGFLPAVAIAGWLGERGWDRSSFKVSVAMLAGNLAIYVPGLMWLGALLGWDQPILAWGLLPFILSDVLKIGLAVVALPAARRLVDRRV